MFPREREVFRFFDFDADVRFLKAMLNVKKEFLLSEKEFFRCFRTRSRWFLHRGRTEARRIKIVSYIVYLLILWFISPIQ